MKNLSQKNYMDILKDLDAVEQNFHRKEYLISNFSRLKSSVPFSPRLNDWIVSWFEQHKSFFEFVDEDDFDPKDIKGTLQRHIDRFNTKRKIHVWTGGSNLTIFGEPQINHFFRAAHEFQHVTNRLGFNFIQESMVCSIQMAQLPNDWVFERQLIFNEIIAQNLYHHFQKDYVLDQRKFSISFILDPSKAIFTKQV